MITIVNELLGVYTPYVNENLDVIQGVSGLDIPYIFGGIIFCIMLSGVLGCIKVILNKM